MKASSQLKAQRERLGLTTTAVAYRLGISQSSFVRLEQSESRGAISIASLEKAAAAIGCEFSYSLKPMTLKPKENIREISTEQRPESLIEEALSEREVEIARSLSAKQRLSRSCHLSDFLRQLRNVRE